MKKDIIEEYERRSIQDPKVNKRKIAEFFEVSHSTLLTILKSKESIKEAIKSTNLQKARRRLPYKTTTTQVNECVLAWFQQLLAQKVPVDGPMRKEKGLIFAA